MIRAKQQKTSCLNSEVINYVIVYIYFQNLHTYMIEDTRPLYNNTNNTRMLRQRADGNTSTPGDMLNGNVTF